MGVLTSKLFFLKAYTRGSLLKGAQEDPKLGELVGEGLNPRPWAGKTLELGEAGTGLTECPGTSSGYQGREVWAELYWLLNYFQKDLNSGGSEPWFLPQPFSQPCPALRGGANARHSRGCGVLV